MSAPPTNGQRILIYGRDLTLLHTRRLVLASAGYDADTVSSLDQLRLFLKQAQPVYELVILCHTISADELPAVTRLASKANAGLYRVQRMEPPPRLVGAASEMMSKPITPPATSLISPHWLFRSLYPTFARAA